MKNLLAGLCVFTLQTPLLAAEAEFIEIYTVQEDDILSKILHKRGIARDDLYEGGWLVRNINANPGIKDGDRIFPGTVLNLILPIYLRIPEAIAEPEVEAKLPRPEPEPLSKPAPVIEDPAVAVIEPTEVEEAREEVQPKHVGDWTFKKSLGRYKFTSLAVSKTYNRVYGELSFLYAARSRLERQFILKRQILKAEVGYTFDFHPRLSLSASYSTERSEIRGHRQTFEGVRAEDKINFLRNQVGGGIHISESWSRFHVGFYGYRNWSQSNDDLAISTSNIGADLSIALIRINSRHQLHGLILSGMDWIHLKGSEPFALGSDKLDIHYRYNYTGVGIALREF